MTPNTETANNAPLAKVAKNGSTARRLRCKECGAPFQTFRLDAKFCGTKCRNDSRNRELVRGAEAARMLIEFRRNRGKGEFTYSDLTNLGDKWVAEDNQRERVRKHRVEAERAVEAGKVELDHPERQVVVGIQNRRLGVVFLDRSRNAVGWRMQSDSLGSTEWLAPSPTAALGLDHFGKPRAANPHIRLFPEGREPAELTGK
ncbi:hypothetical protein [Thalassobaculum sp.]|uniref:hypothetical protein n=1 Tax=Thalassobaculum sp. TaxID=2022740 RepID=UPI0032EEAECC